MVFKVLSMGKKVYIENRERALGLYTKGTRYRKSDGTYAADSDYIDTSFWEI
jgi:hypothetical protein